MLTQISIIIWTFLTISQVCRGATIVETPLGHIEGQILRSENGVEFFSFEGIPYAEPPLGELRFERPKTKLPWLGSVKATKHVQCTQIPVGQLFGAQNVAGTEDCLVLSVYTPSLLVNSANKLPVLFWIHGGGFVVDSGNKDLYGAERLIDHDIVVVSINYRLGPFGFLSSGNTELPGNQGIWDQIEALKWVQNNIEFFNGDSNKVTIAGESAGAMSVMALYFSKAAKGLFHQAISQSGVLNTPFLTADRDSSYHFSSLASHVDCDQSGSTASIIKCLKLKTTEEIVSVLRDKGMHSPSSTFDPISYIFVVDDFSPEPILSGDPLDLIQDGFFNDVPLMIGTNKDEGFMFVNRFVPNNLLTMTKEIWETKGSAMLLGRAEDAIDDEVLGQLQEVTRLYFGTDLPNTSDHVNFISTLSHAFGDAWFQMPALLTSLRLAEKAKSPIFTYSYDYPGSFTFCDLVNFNLLKFLLRIAARAFGQDIFVDGQHTCHGDEILLLFKANALPLDATYTEKDQKVSQNLLRLWTEFIKTGNPSSKWTKLDNTEPMRYKIQETLSEMESFFVGEPAVLQQWLKMYENYPPKMRNLDSLSWKMAFKADDADEYFNKAEL